jgi:fructokinase
MSKLQKPIEEISKVEMADMIDFSNAVGALCVTKRGAIPAMPSMKEVAECRKKRS